MEFFTNLFQHATMTIFDDQNVVGALYIRAQANYPERPQFALSAADGLRLRQGLAQFDPPENYTGDYHLLLQSASPG
jgi:hypothetical protein